MTGWIAGALARVVGGIVLFGVVVTLVWVVARACERVACDREARDKAEWQRREWDRDDWRRDRDELEG
jgi:hypothetical protein